MLTWFKYHVLDNCGHSAMPLRMLWKSTSHPPALAPYTPCFIMRQSDCPVSAPAAILKQVGGGSRDFPQSNFTAWLLGLVYAEWSSARTPHSEVSLLTNGPLKSTVGLVQTSCILFSFFKRTRIWNLAFLPLRRLSWLLAILGQSSFTLSSYSYSTV